jgi:hypothetical protein
MRAGEFPKTMGEFFSGAGLEANTGETVKLCWRKAFCFVLCLAYKHHGQQRKTLRL